MNLLLQHQYAAAEPLAREAADIYEMYVPHLAWRFYWGSVLGAALLGQQRYAEAEPLLLQGYQGMKEHETINLLVKSQVTEVGGWIVRFYESTNQPDKARAWREKVKLKLPNAAPARVK